MRHWFVENAPFIAVSVLLTQLDWYPWTAWQWWAWFVFIIWLMLIRDAQRADV